MRILAAFFDVWCKSVFYVGVAAVSDDHLVYDFLGFHGWVGSRHTTIPAAAFLCHISKRLIQVCGIHCNRSPPQLYLWGMNSQTLFSSRSLSSEIFSNVQIVISHKKSRTKMKQTKLLELLFCHSKDLVSANKYNQHNTKDELRETPISYTI